MSGKKMKDFEGQRACTTCDFCLREDYGYSNYTVEGTTLHCLWGLNPKLDGEENEQWRELSPELAEALDVALTCDHYQHGGGVWVDCDRDSWPYKAEEQTVEAAAAYTDNPVAAGLLYRHFKGLPPTDAAARPRGDEAKEEEADGQ